MQTLSKSSLSEQLKTVYATTFAFFVKSFGFHHNVEGPAFVTLHALFGQIYADAYSALDPTAEYIRTLDEYAPGSFERFQELTQIPSQTKIPRAKLMVDELESNNRAVIALLEAAFIAANSENKQAIANFIAERLSAHGKFGWQLRSIMKEERA